MIMLQALRDQKYTGHIALACHSPGSVGKFHQAGAELVFLPFHDAAERAVNRIIEHDSMLKRSQR